MDKATSIGRALLLSTATVMLFAFLVHPAVGARSVAKKIESLQSQLDQTNRKLRKLQKKVKKQHKTESAVTSQSIAGLVATADDFGKGTGAGKLLALSSTGLLPSAALPFSIRFVIDTAFDNDDVGSAVSYCPDGRIPIGGFSVAYNTHDGMSYQRNVQFSGLVPRGDKWGWRTTVSANDSSNGFIAEAQALCMTYQ